MKKSFALIPLLFIVFSVIGQNKDTANISITNYKLFPGTFSWRGTDQFHDMTSWDSSPYTQGHLKQGTQFKMNYRLLLPLSYNAQYAEGYPIIVMMHGAGERGNCWNDNCYCPDPAECNPNSTPIPDTDPRFLNNDHNLVHGGSPHLTARNLAAGKLPNDPTLAARAFPGLVLFPQNTNQWRNSGSPGNSDVSNVIRIVRLLTKQYNINQDRIYIHGLSMGAQGLLEALNYADWLFAAAAPMSPINFAQTLEYDSVRNIPFWIFQGGQDLNPKPFETEGMINNLRAKGANVRYSLYPNLGHGTWNTAYAEPDFFTWLLSQNKSRIHVDYGKPNVCGTTGEGASLVLPQGFKAYQWEHNGVIIPGANTHLYIAYSPGVYRARYSRVAAVPAESQWNRWSEAVNVGEKSPEAPVIEQLGTLILSDLNLSSVAVLKVPEGFEKYTWSQNGSTPLKALTQESASPAVFSHTGCTGGGPCIHSGEYKLVTEGYDKCPSLPSEPVNIIFGTHNTVIVPPVIAGTPNNFTFELKSPTSVLLKWNDQSTNERGFEIWRRKFLNDAGEDFNKGWVLATVTKEDVTLFLDAGVEPATTYWYKIRAINNAGRSNYFPGNTQANVNHSRVVTTAAENTRPTPPTNVLAMTTAMNTIRITWDASTDDSGINQYFVYFNGDSVATGSDATTFTLDGLVLNTDYNFTMKAQDKGGNLSLPSNPSNSNTYVSGLYYKHSTGAWNTMAEMAATWVTPEFTGSVSTFTLQERTQEDFFNFEFSGFLFINTAGAYTFRTTSDDGSQLFLNNVNIVNNDGLHGNVTVTSTVQNLSAGSIPIMARYFENTGGQTLTVQYRGPDTNNNWVTIPASALKSGNAPALPVPPATPANLVASPVSISTIALTWNANTPAVASYEIQRAAEPTGPFSAISRAVTNGFTDTDLNAGDKYYYRIRATTADTVSAFTAVVNATTLLDTQAPTQPGAPVLHLSGLSTIAITWPASTDNSGVAGYEIYANGILIGSSDINAFQASGLMAATSYTFTVVAVDESGNKSSASAALVQSTSSGTLFYTQASATSLNNLASWKTAGNVAPASFSENGQIFVIKHNLPVGTPWTVEGTLSKVVIDNGITLTIDANPVNATIDINGTGVLNMVSETLPSLGTLSATSKVRYTSNVVKKANYGHLELMGTGAYIFEEGITQVQGNLTTANGAGLKGASSNATTIDLKGDLIMNGTPLALANSFGVALNLSKAGAQNLQLTSDPGFYEIRKSATGVVTLVNAGAPITLTLGSPQGGGLSFASGSEFNVGANSIMISGTGVVNADNETGSFSTNGSSFEIHSSANQDSHLYFNAVANKLKALIADQTGGGKILVHSGVTISDRLKVKSGDLDANGNITLLSTAATTANLEEIENGGRVLGAIKVQRYIPQNPNTTRYLSSAVDGTTIATWQNFFPVTGPFTGASSGATESSLFIYNDPQFIGYPLNTNAPPRHNAQAPIEKGKGYAAKISNATAVVVETSGTPWQGDVAFALTPASTGNNSGWNLIGNPYASTIKWNDDTNAWQRGNVNSTVSVLDNVTTTISQYDYYDAVTRTGTGTKIPNGKIASGHAFWVQSFAGGIPSLVIKEKAKIAEQAGTSGPDASSTSYIRLFLNGSGKKDGAIIAITSFGTDAFDVAYDGYKRANTGMFNFSSLTSDGVAVAINNSADEFCAKQIKLSVQDVVAGNYSISTESLSNLAGIESVKLIDHFTNVTTDLGVTPTYNFQVTADPLSSGSNRFELVLSRSAIELTVNATAIAVCGAPVEIKLSNTQAGVTYSLYDSSDELVASLPDATGEDITFILEADDVANGENEMVVKASLPGCSSAEIPQSISFTYYHKPVVTTSDEAVCVGSTATLTASANLSGVTFEWYLDDTFIVESASGLLVTDVVLEENYYSVIGVQPDGCKGDPAFATVTPANLDGIQIFQQEDSLYTNVIALHYEWFKNGLPLAGLDKAYHFAEGSGLYTVTASSGECSRTSEGYVVTGVNEMAREIDYQVFPNPAHGNDLSLKVNSASPDDIQIVIHDLIGKPIFGRRYSAAEWSEVIYPAAETRLSPGVYFIILEQRSKREVIKIVIE